MWKLTLRNLAAKKGRVVLTGIAVVLGVAFFSGALLTGSTFSDYLGETAGVPYQKADVVVRGRQLAGESQGGDDSGPQRAPVPLDTLATVGGVGGVKEVQALQTGNAQIVKPDGKLSSTTYLGAVWIPESLNPQELTSGKAPAGPKQMVLDKFVAADLGYGVGDTAEVFLRSGSETFTIVGLTSSGTKSPSPLVPLVGFTEAQASNLVQVPDSASMLLVKADAGVAPAALAATIGTAIANPKLESVPASAAIAEAVSKARDDANVLTVSLLVFALLALFVGGFIIFNTFSILVAQRTKEMALLRAIGAYRKQVLRSVLLESVVVGLVASLLGIVIGIGIAGFLIDQFDFGIGVSINTGNLVLSVMVGTVITVLAAYIPARRASKIPPIAAMRDVAVDNSGRSKVRLVIGLLLFVYGIYSLVRGLQGDAKLVGFAAVAVLLSVIVLGPVIAKPFVIVIGAPIRWIKGFTGHLSEENALRNPKRTAATATALTIGVALVGFLLVMAASLKAGFSSTIDKTVKANYLVVPVAGGDGTGSASLPSAVAAAVREVPGVEVVTPSRVTIARVAKETGIVNGFDTVQAEKVIDFDVTEGSIRDLGLDEVAVKQQTADDNHWKIGSKIPMSFALSGARTLTVAALVENSPLGANYVVSLETIEQVAPGSQDNILWVLAPDATISQLKDALEPFKNAEVTTPEIIKDQINSIANQLLAIVIALLGLSIVIAIIGVANTIALSIVERTRELGVLRAVGMSRAQLRSSVRWESTIVAVFGTLLGLVIGVGFAIAVMLKLIDDKVAVFTVLDVPYGQLVIATILAALAGAAAAFIPAWRASRLNPLEAIQTT